MELTGYANLLASGPDFEGRVFVAFLALLLSCGVSLVLGLIGKGGIRTGFEVAVDTMMGAIIHRLNKAERGKKALMIRAMISFGLMALVLALFFIPLQFIAVRFDHVALSHIILLLTLLSPLCALIYAIRFERALLEHGVKAKGVFLPLSLAIPANLSRVDGPGMTRICASELVHSLYMRLIFPLCIYVVLGIFPCLLLVACATMLRQSRDRAAQSSFETLFRVVLWPFHVVLFGVVFLIQGIAALLTPGAGWSHLGAVLSALPAIGRGNGALMLGALCLNMALGGPYQNRMGERVERAWFGPKQATAKMTPKALNKVIYFYAVSLFLLIVFIFALLFFAPERLTALVPTISDLPQPVFVPDP